MSAFYISASTSCLAINYLTGTNAKQLTLYGGSSIQFDNGASYSAIAFTVDATANSFLRPWKLQPQPPPSLQLATMLNCAARSIRAPRLFNGNK